ncbi:MAG TPA: response regulator [Patescibacteria group bacterium]|nr:response regulator [Patescibacteria group bacterium]
MNKTILIIEDDLFVRELYERILEKRGFVVEAVEDGIQGLELARSKSFDLILLDIMLPKKNGLAILKDLREKGSSTERTPVFLLTNLGQESIVREAFRIGADGYLLKARFLPKQVVEEIESFFLDENKRQQDRVEE